MVSTAAAIASSAASVRPPLFSRKVRERVALCAHFLREIAESEDAHRVGDLLQVPRAVTRGSLDVAGAGAHVDIEDVLDRARGPA